MEKIIWVHFLLKHILNTWYRMTWGDNIMLCLISSMWRVRVSILLPESCSELRLRHDMEWPECDSGLLYKCYSRAGHYSAVKKFHETGVEANKVKPGQDYSEREDNRVRYESHVPRGMVMVDESKLKDLIRHSEFAKKVSELHFSGLSCCLAPPFPPR